MLRATRFMACCLLMLTLSACASGLKFTQVNPKMEPQTLDAGRIFFYRPSAFGAALRPDVLLNGQKVGEAISWGFFYVDRPPGEYEAVTKTEVERKVSFVLEKGQTRFIRFSVSFGFFAGHVYGELVDQNVGLSEIEECKYTGGEPSVK
jgi:hypothetical protein